MFGLPIWFLIVNLTLIAVLVLFFVFYMGFNIIVVLRTKTNTFDLVTYTRGKIITDEAGVEYLKVFNKKIRMPAPRPEAISLNRKGKRIVEIELSPEGATRYVVKDMTTGDFKSLNTNDKLFIASGMLTAENRKKKRLSELIMQVAMWSVPMICLVLLLVYWQDVIQPAKEVSLLNAQITKDQQLILSQLSVLKVASQTDGQIIISDDSDAPPTE